MQSITFGQCIGGAWKDAMRMVVKKPFMLLILLVILACANYVKFSLPNAALVGSSAWQGAGISVARLMYTPLHLAVIFGLSVQVIRQSLLGNSALGSFAFFDESFWRYVGVNLLTGAIGGVTALIAVVGIIGASSPGNYDLALISAWCLLGLLAVCAFFFICIRQTVLYCHVAVGGRAGWRIAWSDTRGHFWTIWATLFVAGLPLWVLTVLDLIAIRMTGGHFGISSIWTFSLAITSALGGILGTAVYAAASAWVYRRFASSLVVNRAPDY
jgi:hypothetical protein